MQQYLGVSPESDAQGCLQDVHWSAGREWPEGASRPGFLLFLFVYPI